MSRTRAGAARPTAGVGGAAVDVTDRLTRQTGRVVLVDQNNIPVGTVAALAPLYVRDDITATTWVAGSVTAPAANAVIADSGAVPNSGDWDFDIQIGLADITLTLGKCLLLEHRNAANGATIRTLAMVPQQGVIQLSIRRYTMVLNERLRVINGAVAGAAASVYQAAIGRRIAL